MDKDTVRYVDETTFSMLKFLYHKLSSAGGPIERVVFILKLLLLRILEVNLKNYEQFKEVKRLFLIKENEKKLFSYLRTIDSNAIIEEFNTNIIPFYSKLVSHVDKVVVGNLNDTVKDQLVLIESIFKDSNLLSNVTGGNLSQAISAVVDIPLSILSSRNFLGDVVESALLGTQQMGMHSTPEHIRQFMLALVEPKISDLICDPACGTGGFLLDSFEFIIKRTLRKYEWPHSDAHIEIKSWYHNYFNTKKSLKPSIAAVNNFYRNGLSGVEQLDGIKKIAQVNFYTRVINPENIQQGDALASFNIGDSFLRSDCKTVVFANLLNLGEKKKDGYPNVWKEFSRTAVKTKLFIKMIIDMLVDGGRCAVVVSKAMLTCNDKCGCEVRRLLLEKCNLQAVIELPKGVFAENNGVGTRAAILVFCKGKPTISTWFYAVKNDGYTRKVSRTPKSGCQLVEALDIFYNYIKKGLIPPETDRSDVISAEWILNADQKNTYSLNLKDYIPF